MFKGRGHADHATPKRVNLFIYKISRRSGRKLFDKHEWPRTGTADFKEENQHEIPMNKILCKDVFFFSSPLYGLLAVFIWENIFGSIS